MIATSRGNEAAGRNMIDRRLRHGGSGWGQYPVPERYIASLRSRNETRLLSLMPRLRVKSGTAFNQSISRTPASRSSTSPVDGRKRFVVIENEYGSLRRMILTAKTKWYAT